MKICFIGTVDFSVSVLNSLFAYSEAKIVGVITSKSNTINSDQADLSKIAGNHGIPVLKTNDVNSSETLAWMSAMKPDIIFCFGWSRLIKKELLALSPLGVVGFHPSELPMNRGRHPLIWALALGLSHTASTFFLMDESADSGDIISQEIVPIEYKDDAKSLYHRVTQCAIRQLSELIPSLANGRFTVIKQRHDLSNNWRKRSIADGLIDFRMPARGIYNLVRALTHPYPGAQIIYKGKPLTLWEICEVPCVEQNIEPGCVISVEAGIIIKCGIDAVKIDCEYFKGDFPRVGEYIL